MKLIKTKVTNYTEIEKEKACSNIKPKKAAEKLDT